MVDAKRRNQRATDIDIGKFIGGDEGVGYRRTSRRPPEPIGERDWIDRPPFGSAGRSDDRQADLPIDPADETPDDGSEPPAAASPVDWRDTAVIRKPRMNGYAMGTLEEARARFKAYTSDLPMPWDPIVD
jgi:hypothetical protein